MHACGLGSAWAASRAPSRGCGVRCILLRAARQASARCSARAALAPSASGLSASGVGSLRRRLRGRLPERAPSACGARGAVCSRPHDAAAHGHYMALSRRPGRGCGPAGQTGHSARVRAAHLSAMQGWALVCCVALWLFVCRSSEMHRRSTRTSRAGTRRPSRRWNPYAPCHRTHAGLVALGRRVEHRARAVDALCATSVERGPQMHTDAVVCRAACALSADVQWGIGVQPEHCELEHRERHDDDFGMPLAIACVRTCLRLGGLSSTEPGPLMRCVLHMCARLARFGSWLRLCRAALSASGVLLGHEPLPLPSVVGAGLVTFALGCVCCCLGSMPCHTSAMWCGLRCDALGCGCAAGARLATRCIRAGACGFSPSYVACGFARRRSTWHRLYCSCVPGPQMHTDAVVCRAACALSADVLLGIGVQPERRELEHGERLDVGLRMAPTPSHACGLGLRLGGLSSTEPGPLIRFVLHLCALLCKLWHIAAYSASGLRISKLCVLGCHPTANPT
jgi:hypothetical protein